MIYNMFLRILQNDRIRAILVEFSRAKCSEDRRPTRPDKLNQIISRDLNLLDLKHLPPSVAALFVTWIEAMRLT
jgi:hypothetical protein